MDDIEMIENNKMVNYVYINEDGNVIWVDYSPMSYFLHDGPKDQTVRRRGGRDLQCQDRDLRYWMILE